MTEAAKKAASKTSRPEQSEGTRATKKTSKPAKDSSAAKKQPQNDSKGKVKVTQMVGSIARRWDQEATLKGLGLNKRHRSRVLMDTPEIRGMIYKVRHLVKVEQA